MITIDGGTGRVFIGEVPLVPPQINDDFETILGWADALRRLKVRANADNPEDASRAREFGAQGIGLCRTEHMFFGAERLPVMQEMILADSESGRRAALDRLLPFQQSRLRGDLRGDGGSAGDDPSARSAAARVPARRGGGGRTRSCARGSARLHESNPMLGTRGCRLGLHVSRRSTRCRSARSRARPEQCSSAPASAPLVEVMHPLVGFREELARLRELTESVWAEEAPEARASRRHDDRGAARGAAGRSRSPRSPTSSPSARTT